MKQKTRFEKATEIARIEYFGNKDLSKKERLQIYKSKIDSIYMDADFEEIDKRYKSIKYIQKYSVGMISILISFFFGMIATSVIYFINSVSFTGNFSEILLSIFLIVVAIAILAIIIVFIVNPPNWFLKSTTDDSTLYLYPYEIKVVEKIIEGVHR